MELKKFVIILIFFLIPLATGCNRDYVTEIEDEILKGKEEEIVEEEKPKEKVGIPSPISGLHASEEKVNRRPIVIMFDNHPEARWQAGLSQAEIVYEFMVEAPYTRYMGVYLINEPESIGPIRSSRPYFITTLLEYDPIYVRVGGSPAAKKDIINFKIADIDGLSCPNRVLWRNTKVHKKAPHNTYTTMSILRKYQEEIGCKELGNYKEFDFHKVDTDLEGFEASKILINYYKNNITLYTYNPDEKMYYRQKDGQLHIDELDNSPIKAKNIVIQEAKTKIIDKEGRLSIDLVGEGKGKYITNGKGIDIKWSKKSRDNKTCYYDKMGKRIRFNPGITWIQVVNIEPDINIE